MKKYYFFMALAATALMSACSNDNENEFTPQTSGAKVSFFVDNGPITRTSVNTADASTSFVENDEIGIFATGGATASNAGYKVGAGNEGTLSPIDSDIEWTTTEAGNFYAYYPYAAGNVTDKVKFTVTNQTTADEFNKNDFMVATAANVTNKVATKFKFAHGLSLVQVVLSGSKADEATEVTLTAKPTVEWAFASGALTTSGEAAAIKMWKIDANAQTYWAMVPAQTIAATAAFVNITAGGKNYTYTPSETIELSTAKMKKFNLKLGEAGQAISVSTDMNTEDWGDDGNVDGDTEEKTEPAVELISAAEITEETPFAEQKGKQECVEGWNFIMPETNGSAVIDADENAFAITKTGGYWFNSTIYYCTAEGKATKAVYELKFKMKSTAGNDIQIAVMPCLSENYYFQRVGMNNSYVYQTATTDTYVEYTFKFDLSKLQTTANSTDTATPTAEQINKILVYFTPKIVSESTFYIKDVTFIEVKE